MAGAQVIRSLAKSCSHVQKHARNFLPIAANVRYISLSQRLWQGRQYTKDHEWVTISGGVATVGITDYAQEKLGEIVYVGLPDVGGTFVKDEPVASLESVKAAADVFTPGSGSVTEINGELTNNPSLINKNPYDAGWLFKLELSDPKDIKELMEEEAYQSFIEQDDTH